MRLLLHCLLMTCALSACPAAEGGEELCDDDIDNDADGRIDCADPGCGLTAVCGRCGDGKLDDAEACDDGNHKDDDGCSARCRLEKCGNGELDDGEACDDGNDAPGDGCNFRCEVDRCGNDEIDGAEECDDGNFVSGDGCSPHCRAELEVTCGNFVFDPAEGCEDGNQRSGDRCSARCQPEFCGDGVVQPTLGEQCEGVVSDDGARCEFCRINRCGDTRLDAGEQCDDGNRMDGDGCGGACNVERCGDFIFQPGEQCEDGNAVDGDGCDAQCHSEGCGDGVVQPRLSELCDDGNTSEAPCDFRCRPSRVCATLPSDAERCFDADVRDASQTARSLAVLQAGAQRWIELCSQQSGFVDRHVVDPAGEVFAPYPRSPMVVLGADFNGDAYDDTVTASFEGTLSVNLLAANSVQEVRALPFGGTQGFVVAADLAVGHFDTDGALDAAALGQDGTLALLLDPLGAGTGITTTVRPGAARVLAVPLLSDRDVLLVAAGSELFVTSLNDDGDAVTDAAVATGATIGDVALGDVLPDPGLELVVLHEAPDEVLAWVLTPDAPLGEPQVLCETPGADHVSIGDVDGDGADDLVTSSARGAVTLHLAAEAFTASSPLPAPAFVTRIAVQDLDDDGHADLIGAGGFFSGLLFIYRGE